MKFELGDIVQYTPNMESAPGEVINFNDQNEFMVAWSDDPNGVEIDWYKADDLELVKRLHNDKRN